MTDYIVLSMDLGRGDDLTVHRVLPLADIPWADRKLWAPDAAYKDGTYYLYFPAQDASGIFRIGVATATTPHGPFAAQLLPMVHSYSVDPAVYADTDGAFYRTPPRNDPNPMRWPLAATTLQLITSDRGRNHLALPLASPLTRYSLLRRHLGRTAPAVGGRHVRRLNVQHDRACRRRGARSPPALRSAT
jgi:hypothetical protein